MGMGDNQIVPVPAVPAAFSANDDIAAGGSHNWRSAGIGQVNAVISVQVLRFAASDNRPYVITGIRRAVGASHRS